MAKNIAYDESTIEKFDSIGIIRQRPTVYIHAIGQKGVFKMVLEALDNSSYNCKYRLSKAHC